MLLAFAVRPFAFRTTVRRAPPPRAPGCLPGGHAAARPAGSVTVRRSSELADIAGLLRGGNDGRQVCRRWPPAPRRRRLPRPAARRPARTSIPSTSPPARIARTLRTALPMSTSTTHAGARVGGADRRSDPVGVSPQSAVAGAPRRPDENLLATDLSDQVRKPFRERRRVGDQYNPDHRSSPFIQRSILHCRTGFGKSGNSHGNPVHRASLGDPPRPGERPAPAGSVRPVGPAGPREGHDPRAAAHAPGRGPRRAGPRDGQVPARRGAAPACEQLPRRERAARRGRSRGQTGWRRAAARRCASAPSTARA